MKLTEIQQAAAAIFNDQGVVTSFNNDEQALEAFNNSVAIYDRSHWGLLKITGADRLRYLHNQSTNEFEKLRPGQGCNTTFVTSTARTLDLATAYITEDAVIVLVSPNRREKLFSWLDQFIFPFDKVELSDISAEFKVFSLYGPQSQAILAQLTSQAIPQPDSEAHVTVNIDDISLRISAGGGLATNGYTLILNNDDAALVWSKLAKAGAIPFGDLLWERLRIEQGRPSPDKELTEDYNPLEAGLWQTVSFEKGCYIGQETIARLNTYKGVKQKLWGIELSQTVDPQTLITLEGKKVGVLTSYTNTNKGAFGLGYIRTKAGFEGLQVNVGDAEGILTTVPFVEHLEQK